MTVNQTIARIKKLALSHKQIRSFGRGLLTDFLTDQTTKYPAVFLSNGGGTISTSGHDVVLNFSMVLVDLVHVSEETKTNEQDVHSDMVSVAMDLVAQMNFGGFDDWFLSADNQLTLIVEGNDDQYAGCQLDFTIRTIFTQNVCDIPTDMFFTPGESSSEGEDIINKLVYDLKYTATGDEGLALSIGEIVGKKILFITRESGPIYKVSNDPDSAEFTFDGTTIGLGAPTNAGDRFLILYRNN